MGLGLSFEISRALMAIFAKLQFGDNYCRQYSSEYPVLWCKCHFYRQYNHIRPEEPARCEKITIKVVAPGKDDLSLYDWYASDYVLSGRLVFDMAMRNAVDDETKEILFEDAHCLSLSEKYDIDSEERRLLTLEIVSEKIVIDAVEFEMKEDRNG